MTNEILRGAYSKESNYQALVRHLEVYSESTGMLQKWAIMKYILSTPLRKLNPNSNHKYSTNIILKKDNGSLIDCGKYIADVGIVSDWLEPEVTNYLLNNINDGVFIDVGAHFGKHTINMAKHLENSGRVISFEAHPVISKKLIYNVKLNKMKNVLVVPKACADKTGNIYFYANKKGVAGGHSIAGKLLKDAVKISVPCTTIDDIIFKNKINNVKCIKIDVERAEAIVLKGARKTIKKFKPKIIFEIADESEMEKVMKELKPFNYKITNLNPPNIESNYLAEVKQ